MKVHIVGSGAIGGLAGAWMSMGGEDVTFVDVNKDHVEALRTKGLLIDGARGDHVLPAQKAFTPAELNEPLECVFLACKAQHTAGAVDAIKHLLGSESFVVSLQNGLINEEVIAGIIGKERTVGALPDYGGAYVDPGHIEFVHEGPVYVGELDGMTRPRTQECYRLLSHLTKCELTDNIGGRIWAKTTYSAQVITSALVNAPVYEVLGDERAKRVAGPCVAEGLVVAYGYDADVPGGPFFDPKLYFPKTPEETKELFDCIDRGLAIFRDHQIEQERSGLHKYVKKASGIHWDIVHRKRKSEVRWIDGPLEEKAAAKGIPTPLLTRLHSMIYEIEDGTREMGWHNIDEMNALIASLGKQLP
jgi:2-dehydropantoate 2-reductase